MPELAGNGKFVVDFLICRTYNVKKRAMKAQRIRGYSFTMMNLTVLLTTIIGIIVEKIDLSIILLVVVLVIGKRRNGMISGYSPGTLAG